MTTTFPVGWVLRASSVGFAVGCRVLQPATPEAPMPQFGDLVKVPLSNSDDTYVFGLIYDVQVPDDPSVRQLILTGEMEPEVMRDQRENRLVPIEVSVLVVGYQRQKRIFQGLPPQPPISLDSLIMCDDEDIRAFTNHLDYLRLTLNSAQIPADELVIANLRRAAQVRSPETQRQFLVRAGRELARLLSADLIRLDNILRRIRPQ